MTWIYFFTDFNTKISNFCLLNIKDYKKRLSKNKFIYFIDPGVYELKDSAEYSKIELLHELANGKLLENEWISIDYPCDMNEAYTETFIEKSIKNNLRYKNNPQYICTIQFKFQDFKDFKYQFEYLEEQIDFSKKIIGIGNLCRIMKPNLFTDEVFEFLKEKYYEYDYYFHFYGLSLSLIKKYLHVFKCCGVDSTKWTRACNNNLKKSFGLNCNKKTRNLYFISYMENLYENGFFMIF